ncbi:hypothetical protein C8Q79DRAFT_646735 [Trametes meyenii]|nr:hypothetical protein C8Q79DRAFT_646735 [Trametes meyenii]
MLPLLLLGSLYSINYPSKRLRLDGRLFSWFHTDLMHAIFVPEGFLIGARGQSVVRRTRCPMPFSARGCSCPRSMQPTTSSLCAFSVRDSAPRSLHRPNWAGRPSLHSGSPKVDLPCFPIRRPVASIVDARTCCVPVDSDLRPCDLELGAHYTPPTQREGGSSPLPAGDAHRPRPVLHCGGGIVPARPSLSVQRVTRSRFACSIVLGDAT